MINASFTRTAQIKITQLVKSHMLTEKYDKAKDEGCFVDELTDELLELIGSGDNLERVGKWTHCFMKVTLIASNCPFVVMSSPPTHTKYPPNLLFSYPFRGQGLQRLR